MNRHAVPALLACLLLAAAALAPASAAPDRQATVAEVITLLEAGIGSDVVLRLLRREGATYELTADDLLGLHQAGASEALLGWMIDGTLPEPSRASDRSADDEREPRDPVPARARGVSFLPSSADDAPTGRTPVPPAAPARTPVPATESQPPVVVQVPVPVAVPTPVVQERLIVAGPASPWPRVPRPYNRVGTRLGLGLHLGSDGTHGSLHVDHGIPFDHHRRVHKHHHRRHHEEHRPSDGGDSESRFGAFHGRAAPTR